MFKKIALLIVSIGMLAACASPIVPVALVVPTAVPTTMPTATLPPTSAPTAAPTAAPPAPVAPALNSQPPASCIGAGQQTYVNPFDGYCFAYPSRFTLQTSPTGQPQLFGPALDQNLDALRASLTLEVEVAVKDARLNEVIDRYVQQFAGMNVPAIARTPIVLGGEPAEMIEVVPGREGSRDVFMLHEGTLYHFMFMPSVRDFPPAKHDVEELYTAVTQSFTFTSKKPRPLATPAVSASPRDPGISGVAYWGTQPVPDAIVVLQTGDGAVVQRALTDPEGRYFMANPPVGDYFLCGLFPEGVKERSKCESVHVEAGQEMPGHDVMLARTLLTTGPAVDEQVTAAPTLSWQRFPNAVKYEVFVIDAGTTELVQHEFVTDPLFTVKSNLKSGRTYTWAVNALAADGGLLADVESRFIVQPSVPAGTGVTVGPLSVVLPPALASGAHGSQIPRAAGSDLPYWELTPGHSVLKLEGYPLPGKTHQPQIYVYPAQAYAEMAPAAFESIHRLDNIVYGPPAQITSEQLPAVPFFNAQQAFASDIKQLSFQNGAGVRFVTEYAQYPASANNTDLFYHFQGVSSDGKYYIIAILPINHPRLAATSDGGAVLPPGGVPYPDISAPNADLAGYYQAVTDLLNTQAPESFTPTLDQLDALIQSIRVQ